jgi:hypothetical protein
VSAVSCPTGEYIADTKTAGNTPKCYACPSRASATAYRVEEELNDSGGFTAKCHYSDGVKEVGVKRGEPTVGDVISPIVAVRSSVTEYAAAMMTPMPAEGCSWPATQGCLSTQSSQPCGGPTEAGCSCNCSKCPEGFQATYVATGPTCGKCDSSHPVLVNDKCYASCGAMEQMRCPWGECGCYQLPQNVTSPTLFEHTVMFTVSCPAGLPAEGTYGYSDQKCYVCPHGGDRVQKIYPSGEVKCVGRAQCGNAACAAAISSINDAALSLMKTGFTVSPRPWRVKAVVCWRSKRVCMRARSGVRQGVQKGVCGALTQLPVQACGALPDNDGRKGYTVYATYFSYPVIYARATACGLPASIVQLAPIMGYLDSRFSVSVCVYYSSTNYKAVRVGGGFNFFLFAYLFFRTLRSR